MSIVKMLSFFVSGMLLIGGTACIAIFFHNGSVEAIGGAVMFLCFGGAGMVLTSFSSQILNALRSDDPETA